MTDIKIMKIIIWSDLELDYDIRNYVNLLIDNILKRHNTDLYDIAILSSQENKVASIVKSVAESRGFMYENVSGKDVADCIKCAADLTDILIIAVPETSFLCDEIIEVVGYNDLYATVCHVTEYGEIVHMYSSFMISLCS